MFRDAALHRLAVRGLAPAGLGVAALYLRGTNAALDHVEHVSRTLVALLIATVVREGGVVLPGRLVVDVIRALPGDEVPLELRPSEQDVEIVGGSATFHIRTLGPEDFRDQRDRGDDLELTPGSWTCCVSRRRASPTSRSPPSSA